MVERRQRRNESEQQVLDCVVISPSASTFTARPDMAAVTAPAALTTHSGQPVYPPNLLHNNQSLYYVKSTTACLAGALAGVLGLTNLAGFALFGATSVSVGAAYAAVHCRARPARYFLKPSEPILAGSLSNCFSFILFWTLFYSLVYIYD